MDAIKDKKPEDLVHLDETGIDDNETYEYAWSMKGQRVWDTKYGKRKNRLSIISALFCGKLIAPFTFEGTCDKDVFKAYVKNILLPELKEGQTLILDNASFHKGKDIENILKEAKVELLYLPPYSPDLNPIENYWAPLKYHIKKYLQNFNRDLFEASSFIFKNVLN